MSNRWFNCGAVKHTKFIYKENKTIFIQPKKYIPKPKECVCIVCGKNFIAKRKGHNICYECWK